MEGIYKSYMKDCRSWQSIAGNGADKLMVESLVMASEGYYTLF